MKKILIILFLIPYSLFAQHYYVDNTGTGDTLATIAEVNALTLGGDDTVSFKCGCTWRETLVVPNSGIAGHYVIFNAYGTGAKPRILGSDQATGFENRTGNIWKATNELIDPFDFWLPIEIFFIDLDDSIKWGNHKDYTANFSNLVAEYDWTWHGDTIYVYAATDPDSRYASVEAPQRMDLIDINEKEYIEIDSLELAYGIGGVSGGPDPNVAKNGFKIRYCKVHHHGDKNDGGYGTVDIVYNNSLFEYNEFYDCGRRGISLGHSGANDVSNIIVRHNIFHDGYHTAALENGATYRVEFTITEYTSGSVDINISSGRNTTDRSSVGTFVENLTCATADENNFYIRTQGGGNCTLKIDNVSIRKIL